MLTENLSFSKLHSLFVKIHLCSSLTLFSYYIPCDFNSKWHWHRCEPHHALDGRRVSRILRLKPERLQEAGHKEKEFRTSQMLPGTRSFANREGNEVFVPLHLSLGPDESFRHELLSSAPFLALLSQEKKLD